MKKLMVALVVVVFVFSSFRINAGVDELTVRYSFSMPTIKKIEVGTKTYDAIEMKNTAIFGRPGQPALPAAPSYILIPYGKDVASIEVRAENKQEIGKYNIMPIEKALPLNSDIRIAPQKNGSVYSMKEAFPGRLYDVVGIQYFRGFKILILRLYPVQYVPAYGKLFYYKNMDVEIKLKDGKVSNLFRGLREDAIEVAKKVDNIDAIKTYPCNKEAEYDILIITSKQLKKYFEPLKEYHATHGKETIIATLDETGKDEKNIRNYIREEYKKDGISYVLLGGDVNIVPAPVLWVCGYDENVDYYETKMPSDIYYACLDGTYNYDNDSRWGEPNDGPNGGDVDLMAEVYVGRACVDDGSDASNFVSKTIAYMKSNDEYLKRVCMAGEYLGDYGVASYGGNYLDQLIGNCDANNYSTVGFPEDKFEIDKLYDRDWQNHYWDAQEIIDRINNGVHIINHLGHSSIEYNMRLTNDDVDTLLKNTKYCFIYSQGCFAGAFDYNDCIAEHYTVKTKHGAFAGVWNARYGFFWSYSTDGDSQRYHREFWNAVFGKNIYVIGRANHASKEANLYIIHRSMMRWCYYETNLFGDPAVEFHVDNPPAKPERPEGIRTGKVGNAYNFTTSTTDIDGDEIYYMWDWGDGSNTTWLGPYKSGEIAKAQHSWKEKGRYEVRVKAKDEHGMESDWSDPLPITMPAPPIFATIKWLSHFFDFLRYIINSF